MKDVLYAEQGLVLACLQTNELIDLAADLTPEMFGDAAMAAVWQIIRASYFAGAAIDAPLLLTKLKTDRPELVETVQNVCADVFFTGTNAKEYAAAIRDAWLTKKLQMVLSVAYQDIETKPASEILASLADSVVSMDVRIDERTSRPIHEAIDDVINSADLACKAGGLPAGLSTGFSSIDAVLGGLSRSDLVILAARPSMGKTALAMNIASNVANGGHHVAFFSMEMSADQLARRMLASEAGLNNHAIAAGQLSVRDFDLMLGVKAKFQQLKFSLDDAPQLTIASLRTRLRRLARQSSSLDLVIVDYLQLMNHGSNTGENRVAEVSAISRGLKMLAKEFNVPILALSQLSRALESREDKRPMLSDLRESGSIEQDADIVCFVYRDEYYLSRAEPRRRDNEDDQRFNARYTAWQTQLQAARNQAEFIIAKHRHGKIGAARLAYDADYVRFADECQRTRK